jgi:hypothetical protein
MGKIYNMGTRSVLQREDKKEVVFVEFVNKVLAP